MGGLAHYLEAAGLATTQISLIREHTEKIRPPRALWVPFPFGRPLGVPNDAAFQRRVLLAALKLSEAAEGPVLENFPEEAPAEDGITAWSCPVTYAVVQAEKDPKERLVEAFQTEAAQLRSWYDLSLQRRGRTTVGVSGMNPEAVARRLSAWLAESTPDNPREDLPLADALRLAIQDLKAFYFEAVAAQPGAATPTNREFSDWFWRQTAAGAVLREIQKVCLSSEDESLQLVGQLLIVPMDQMQ